MRSVEITRDHKDQFFVEASDMGAVRQEARNIDDALAQARWLLTGDGSQTKAAMQKGFDNAGEEDEQNTKAIQSNQKGSQ